MALSVTSIRSKRAETPFARKSRSDTEVAVLACSSTTRRDEIGQHLDQCIVIDRFYEMSVETGF